MIKITIIAALALAAVPAFSQDGMMTMKPDAKGMKRAELLSFLEKDAYRKVSAPHAYVLTSFLNSLPGNLQTAIARGLVQATEASYDLKDRYQMDANAMGPSMGSASGMTSNNSMSGETAFEKLSMRPMGELSYPQAISILQAGQDQTDQGLIATVFRERSFTQSLIPTVMNERQLDAIVAYLQATAAWTQPSRLKYTSLAPRAPYAGLPADWASQPWPMTGR